MQRWCLARSHDVGVRIKEMTRQSLPSDDFSSCPPTEGNCKSFCTPITFHLFNDCIAKVNFCMNFIWLSHLKRVLWKNYGASKMGILFTCWEFSHQNKYSLSRTGETSNVPTWPICCLHIEAQILIVPSLITYPFNLTVHFLSLAMVPR